MRKARHGSTLVMAVLLFAFVLIIGGGLVMMASMSSRQSSNTLGNEQADYTAKSVLDAVIAQIQAGKIDPAKVAADTTLDCGGQNVDLGNYNFSIRQYDDGKSTPNLYKVSVTANYSGYESKMFDIIQGIKGEDEEKVQSQKFKAIGMSTAYGAKGNNLNSALIYGDKGDLILNNGGDQTLSNGGRVEGNIKVKGNLTIGQYEVGTAGKDTVINTEGNLTVSGSSAIVNSDIYSEKAVTLSGGATVNGDVNANQDIIISGGATVTGNVHTNGSVNVSNDKTHPLTGDIYANGSVTVASGSIITGNIYADGNVVVNGTVSGNILTHGTITISSGTVSGETMMAAGDIVLTGYTHTNNIINILSKGSVYFVGGNIKANVSAYSNIVVGSNKSGSGYGSTINGALLAKGNVTICKQSNTTTNIAAMGDVLLQDWGTTQTGEIVTNGSITVTNATMNGNAVAQKNFTLNQNAAGNVMVGGYASITSNKLTGNLWACGGGYFPNAGCVSGTIYLSGPYTGAATGNNVVMVDASEIDLAAPLLESDFNFWQEFDVQLKKPLVDVEIDTDAPKWAAPSDELAKMREIEANIDFNNNGGANYTINGDEYIVSQNCILTLSNYKGTKKVVFDTTQMDKDLYILLKDPKGKSTVSIQQGLDFLTKGDHNVFIFLDDSETGSYVNLSVGAWSFFGYYDYQNGIPADDKRAPNLYIVSNSSSSIEFTSNSTLYGFIYAPYGTLSMSGSPISSSFLCKLYGAVVASKISFESNQKFKYYATNLTEEESGNDNGEEGSGGSGTGTTQSWAVIGTYMGSGE